MKHEISIPGLPEGWRAVAYRRLKNGDFYLNEQCEIVENYALKIFALIVEKIKPRSIKLEETEEDTDPLLYQPIKIDGLCVLMVMHNKYGALSMEE